ncbi:MAG: hypothetical protein Kow0037_23970 [Calditrichia bacterium]
MLKSLGIFMECLPDDLELCKDPSILKQNISRLKFYERFGARPIINTKYETPVKDGEDNPPYLVLDDLGQNLKIPRNLIRKIVRVILERKYGHYCPPSYIDMVVDSFRDDFVQLRPFRYIKENEVIGLLSEVPEDRLIHLIVNDQHQIHHVHERGYVESPVRISAILKQILPVGLFREIPVKHFGIQYIMDVHDKKFVQYFKAISNKISSGKSVYPYVFPIRNKTRPPKELPIRAGYYCIDTFTPLNAEAYKAARRAVDCALTGAEQILNGHALAYALVRPPGHHAEREAFGGFCYFNSSAIAANYLSRYGKVAILDLDYHHGNGQQDIFYNRRDVLTISLHGHPSFAYPYFSGYSDELGEGEGLGYNFNFPLPENVDGRKYRLALEKAIAKIEEYDPAFLVVALGLDTAKGDPTGTWSLSSQDFYENGKLIANLKKPTLIVQEGGYNSRNLGINAKNFFMGLAGLSRK